MTEVTNELIYEVLKKLQADMGSLGTEMREVKSELDPVRGHMLSIQTDFNNIYQKMDRHDEQLDRIERRLELRELAEPQRPYDPHE